jgi:hypothetical protein
MKVPFPLAEALRHPEIAEEIRRIVRDELRVFSVKPATDDTIERVEEGARRGVYPEPLDALRLIARIRSAESK